jgi:hypothetical protein
MKKTTLLTLFAFLLIFANAQNPPENSTLNTDLGFDFVNRYLWRGTIVNASPNLQPYLGLEYKGFNFGAWGSYATDGQFAEVDLFLSYSYEGLTLTLNDYYTENEDSLLQFDNFNFNDDKTNHALEFMVNYEFGEKLPLTLSAATIFYGNDKDEKGNNYYSTWLQANYTFKLNDYDLDVFVGATPAKSIYNSKEGNVAEIGAKLSKSIDISEKFSIPMSVALVTNPAEENIFMILSIGLN